MCQFNRTFRSVKRLFSTCFYLFVSSPAAAPLRYWERLKLRRGAALHSLAVLWCLQAAVCALAGAITLRCTPLRCTPSVTGLSAGPARVRRHVHRHRGRRLPPPTHGGIHASPPTAQLCFQNTLPPPLAVYWKCLPCLAPRRVIYETVMSEKPEGNVLV